MGLNTAHIATPRKFLIWWEIGLSSGIFLLCRHRAAYLGEMTWGYLIGSLDN